MTDFAPPAGWYADGVTTGVLRWFDGSRWTENTTPLPTAPAAPPVVAPAVTPARTPGTWSDEPGGWSSAGSATGHTGFGVVPDRLGQSLNLADRVRESPAYQRNRLDEARRVRRNALATYGCGLLVLVLSGSGTLALRGGNFWWIGGIVAVVLVARAVRDYQRALFRGAPALTVAGRVLAGAALVGALATFFAVPVVTAVEMSTVLEGAGP